MAVAIEPAVTNFSSLFANIRHNRLEQKIISLPIGLGKETCMTNLLYQNVEPGGASGIDCAALAKEAGLPTRRLRLRPCFVFTSSDNGLPSRTWPWKKHSSICPLYREFASLGGMSPYARPGEH